MAVQPKQWSVFVYMAGENDLSENGELDLREMKKVGSTDHVNIIVQFDRAGLGAKKSTRRLFIMRGNIRTIKSLGPTECGDPQVLQEFLSWGMQAYPAQHYAVILWNHGNGWGAENIYRAARKARLKVRAERKVKETPAILPEHRVSIIPERHLLKLLHGPLRRSLFRNTVAAAVKAKAISTDDDARDFLDSVELKRVFSRVVQRAGRPFDILGMDACLMNMIETAYQLRGTVQWCIGSEQTEPSDGWPYGQILSGLIRNPSMTPPDVASLIVDTYLTAYADSEPVTLSALNFGPNDQRLLELKDRIDRLSMTLVDACRTTSACQLVMAARHRAQWYENPAYVDLYHLCRLLADSPPGRRVNEAALGILEILNVPGPEGFILREGHKGWEMTGSHGVSVYFPEDYLSPLYATLDFAADTHWETFLATILKGIGRPVVRHPEHETLKTTAQALL
ncbi:MAG: hypothetical protein HY710_06515 [Candidatus Latescibacteria bacterium]|nr:hypothetical protein [Candidatus Latescibacterota bacterium]